MSALSELDDRGLLAAFRNETTREKAFSELVKRYQERLYWHIRRMVVNHDDANDILQNVFIKVWKNLAEFREEANLYTWLYRIGTNETLTWLDQQKRRAALSLSADDEDNNSLSGRLKSEQGYDANKIEWKLQQAIQTLPEKQRIVFNFRYYDEMPYDKMSEILGTSEGALKASYHHAVKKIESFLKGI